MDRELTLVEHLAELRKRIIISLFVLLTAAALSFPFTSVVLKIVRLPASGLIERLVFFSPQDALMVRMHLAFLCGLVISIPVILYQFWAFILPAAEEGKMHTDHQGILGAKKDQAFDKPGSRQAHNL